MTSKKASDILEKVNDTFNKITEFQAKYGNTQGTREDNKELFWFGNEKPDSYEYDTNGENTFTDFILKDISRSELVYTKLVKTIRELNRTAFENNFEGKDMTEGLKDRIADTLFQGRTAIIKIPGTDKYTAEMFEYDFNDLDLSTNLPKKITIVSSFKAINGKTFGEGEFAIGFNSSSRTAELAYDLVELEQIINSTMSLALAIRKSKPKTLITGLDDDTLAYDIKRAIQSDEWVEFLGINAKKLEQLDIRFDSQFKEKMEMQIAAINNFMKFKGWNTNGMILKRERQSEKELDNDDTFNHFLIHNKIIERERLAEMCREKLGLDITYNGQELLDMIKGEDETWENGQTKNQLTQE